MVRPPYQEPLSATANASFAINGAPSLPRAYQEPEGPGYTLAILW